MHVQAVLAKEQDSLNVAGTDLKPFAPQDSCKEAQYSFLLACVGLLQRNRSKSTVLEESSSCLRQGGKGEDEGAGTMMGSDQQLGPGAARDVIQVCTPAAEHGGTQRLCLGFWGHLGAGLHLMPPSWG